MVLGLGWPRGVGMVRKWKWYLLTHTGSPHLRELPQAKPSAHWRTQGPKLDVRILSCRTAQIFQNPFP